MREEQLAEAALTSVAYQTSFPPMQCFANKLAVVTGGGRGIGQEIARTLAAGGAKVAVMTGAKPDDLEKLIDEHL